MRTAAVALVAFALLAASCGDSSAEPDSNSAATTSAPTATSADSDNSADSDSSAEVSDTTQEPSEPEAVPSAGGAGTLTLNGETVEFDSARCFLEEQDAAAGGGKILFVAQAFGETAAGEEIMIDVSRYDENSQFTGDDISVLIGDPFSDDAVDFYTLADLGTVVVDGSMLSASGLVFMNGADLTEQAGSFDISC